MSKLTLEYILGADFLLENKCISEEQGLFCSDTEFSQRIWQCRSIIPVTSFLQTTLLLGNSGALFPVKSNKLEYSQFTASWRMVFLTCGCGLSRWSEIATSYAIITWRQQTLKVIGGQYTHHMYTLSAWISMYREIVSLCVCAQATPLAWTGSGHVARVPVPGSWHNQSDSLLYIKVSCGCPPHHNQY